MIFKIINIDQQADLVTGNVTLKVIRTFISKDLEIFNWTNCAAKQFGEFQIYKDIHLELNSFDLGLSLLVGREIVYGDNGIETDATDICIEYLFNYIMDRDVESIDIDFLSNQFVHYLVDVSCYCLQSQTIKTKKHLEVIFRKYFPEYRAVLLKNIN